MIKGVGQFFDQLQLRLAIKAGVTATLSLIVGIAFGRLFDRPDTLISGLWTVLSSIVVVNAYLGGTYIAALIRLLGTSVGALIAGICITFIGVTPILLGIAVALTVILCSLMRLNESVRIASITTALIMVMWGAHPELSPWLFGFYRFIDSTIGIAIAVIVAHTLWPAQATGRVRTNMATIMEKLRLYYLNATGLSDVAIESSLLTADINTLLNDCRDYLKTSRIEIRTRSSLEDWQFLLEHLRDLCDAVTTLGTVSKERVDQLCDKQLTAETIETLNRLDKMMVELITILTMRQPIECSVDIATTFDEVDSRLRAFRQRHKEQQSELEVAESFFVFFYSLRRIGNELLKLSERLDKLYGESGSSAAAP